MKVSYGQVILLANAALFALLIVSGWKLLPLLPVLTALLFLGLLVSCRWRLSKSEQMLVAFPLGILVAGVLTLVLGILRIGILLRPVAWALLAAAALFSIVRLYKAGWFRRAEARRALVSPQLFGVLLVAAVVFMTYGHLLTSTLMPKTDALGYLERGHFARAGLAQEGRIGTWYPNSQLGYPVYTFDPPLFFVWYGLTGHLAPYVHPIALFNQLFFVILLWIAFGMYVLLRRFAQPVPSALGAAIAVTIPHLTTAAFLSGNIKLFLAYAGLPAFALAAYDGKHAVLTGLLFTFIILSHTSLAPFAVVLLVLFALERAVRTRAPAQCVRFLGAVLAMAVVASAFFAAPLLWHRSSGFSSPSQELRFALPAPSYVPWAYGGEPSHDADGRHGLLLGLAVLLAAGILIWRRPEGGRFAGIILASFGVVVAAGSLPLLASILVEYSRIEPVLLLAHGILLGLAAGVLLRRSRLAGMAACAVLAGLLLWYAPAAEDRTIGFVSDQVLTRQLEEPNRFFLSLPHEHRFTTYGTPALPLHPTLATAFGISVNGYGFRQGQHADIWYTSLYNLANESPPANADGMRLFNLLRATNTRFVWTDLCQAGGNAAFGLFLNDCKDCGIKKRPVVEFKASADCGVALLTLPNTTHVESMPVYRTGEDVRALYSKPFASRATYVAGAVPGVPVLDVADFSVLSEPEPLRFTRPSPDELRVTVEEPGWITIKEEFFPRWRATLDSKRLPIYKTNLGLMAVNAPAAGELVLRNDALWWEKLLAVLSGGALLALLMVRSKKPEARSQ